MRTVWQNAQNSKSSFRWVPPGSRRNVNWNLFTAISGIYWSQTLRNATGRLSAICCWCVFLWSKTSQNRPSHSRLNLKIFAVPYLGQNSSKFPPKPLLVEKLVSRTVYCRHFLGQYFQSAASVGSQTTLNFATQCVPNLWARKHEKIQRSCPLRDRRNVNLTKFDVRDI